jgi:hypothetical protein
MDLTVQDYFVFQRAGLPDDQTHLVAVRMGMGVHIRIGSVLESLHEMHGNMKRRPAAQFLIEQLKTSQEGVGRQGPAQHRLIQRLGLSGYYFGLFHEDRSFRTRAFTSSTVT